MTEHDHNAAIELLAKWLREARSAVAFTGAGVSTESGIPDFRSPGGVWSKYQPVDYRDFMRDADARGGERLLESASANDLRVLALAARYTGRRAFSLRAWQALRARYVADAQNQGAAFFLARGHEEQGEVAEAMRWLARYLAESPSGAYASEALGRRLVLLSKAGQKTDAVSAAHAYLERYPRGAYAKSAQLVLQSE